jgi:hypothetical protein
MSDKPRNVRKSLLELFRKLRRERNVLLLAVAKQRVKLEMQTAIIREYKKMENSYRSLVDELRELSKESHKLAEMATRHRNLVRAANTERDETTPLQ